MNKEKLDEEQMEWVHFRFSRSWGDYYSDLWLVRTSLDRSNTRELAPKMKAKLLCIHEFWSLGNGDYLIHSHYPFLVIGNVQIPKECFLRVDTKAGTVRMIKG
ncbi:MAG: hypothetical protein HN909_02540 [Phycisphaerales bacterium]|jgi:hypothetical protein|nr:hypothetical protein [Phycisphaerales bacterium]MBT7170629.1 hypothetical protein [Phycisphaerales bacterium]